MYRQHIILFFLFFVGILHSKAQQNQFKQTGYYAYVNNSWIKISEREAYSGKYPSARHVKVEETKKGKIYSVTGITPKKNEEKKNKTLLLFPNPAQNNMQAAIKEPLKKATLTIYDMTGKVVITTPYQNNQQVNVSALSNGIYMVILKDDTEQFTDKLIISR